MSKQWEKIQNNLKKSVKSGIFQVWIKPLEGSVQDKTLFLTAPNEFVASWIRDRLQDKITNTAREVLGYEPNLSIQGAKHKTDPAPTSPGSNGHRLQLPVKYESAYTAPAKWRFCFEDFLVGHCNQLAYAACTSLCNTELPAGSVFLCSGPGLGKTHLLHAIGNQLCQSKGHGCAAGRYSRALS